jgi:hypothetical protein
MSCRNRSSSRGDYKNPTKLSPSGLLIYANKEAFERKDDPLHSKDNIGDYGMKESKLYVVVPASQAQDEKRQKVEVSGVSTLETRLK